MSCYKLKIKLNLIYLGLLVSIFFRFFVIFVLYTMWQKRFWPNVDGLLQLEKKFILVSLPFWLLPLILGLKKTMWNRNVALVAVSFLPELFVILFFPAYSLISQNAEASLNIFLYVSLAILFFSELSFFVTYFNQKKMIKELSKGINN